MFPAKRLPLGVALETKESSQRAADQNAIGRFVTPKFHYTPSSSTYVEGNHPILPLASPFHQPWSPPILL